MSYNVSFISLGCAKNQVNCEQMMALCSEAGYAIQAEPAGCDVVVVNTCGFLASACEEAIENILEMAELKKAGQVKKILVTGCMTSATRATSSTSCRRWTAFWALAATATLPRPSPR